MMDRDTCVHFRGIQHDECKAGVRLATVKDTSGGGPFRWPCLPPYGDAPCTTTCASKRFPTSEELAASEAEIQAALAKLDAGDYSGAVCVTTTGEHRNPIGKVASLDMVIAIGFGSAVAVIGPRELDGERWTKGDGWLRVRDAEKAARRYLRARRRMRLRGPRPLFEIAIYGPLWEAVWRRERPGKWVCISAGEGFA